MGIQKLLLLAAGMWYCVAGRGQSYLRGKIFDKGYDRVVIAATVSNLNNKTSSASDMGGNYKIAAKEGDNIIFSSTGYFSDTVKVEEYMLRGGLDVFLEQHFIELEEVGVGELNKYQVDSLSRAEEFSQALNTPTSRIVGGKGNSISDGVGVTFSPLSHFSKKEKNERKFKRMFYKQEKEYYIDFKFPYNYVSKITGLEGDSLRTFMYTYRPSYEFCRANDREAMLVYINDKYREYKHQPAPQTEENKKKKKKKKD